MQEQSMGSEQEREKLRALFSANAQRIYQRALENSGSPDRAKEILARVFRDAARTPALCLCREGYLLELCDTVCRQTKPLEEILHAAVAQQPGREASTPTGQKTGASVAVDPEPIPRVRRIETTRPETSEEYRLEEDEWLLQLREQRRKAREVQPSAAAQPPLQRPPAAPIRSGREDLGILEEFEPPQKRIAARLGIGLLCILILGLLWSIAGLLMNLGILPWLDLGYSWFNTHVFNMF